MATTTAVAADLAFEVRGLRKSYGKTAVLEGVDLRIPRGSVFALLGPNGAGKTTTVQILSTLISADGGSARVGGFSVADEPERVRGVIGVTGQFSAVDDLLSGAENLRLMARLRHIPRGDEAALIADLLREFDLAEAADRPASTYSGGMRRRLDLAMTLVGDPQIIFLDEPTTGLDPRSRNRMWDVVRELVARGVTILLTTQYLEEADQLADRIAVLDGGRIVAEGTPSELKRRVGDEQLRLRFDTASEASRARDALAAVVPGNLPAPDAEHTLHVPVAAGAGAIRNVLNTLAAAGLDPVEVSTAAPDLDDVFLALTGSAAVTTQEQS
ncbi:ATP-binding cassette domain-containing protein [Zhihengliuella halotolerans]|uniref:ABC-2 type transport system ATP-binding protein n=1 Tax=Zhihengliuella halotolerans TaxID=370736 RepID=A0A4Q8AIF8_9MICC|nr:ATP-binding cassette domain-containing protein [Zhihengliuella halotolerans]RZU63529.1 ABC-2 type transport system ATP-binding protein [Zhihengliuella halotolerans]